MPASHHHFFNVLSLRRHHFPTSTSTIAMSFRTPAALTSRAITVRLPSSLLSLGIPLAAVRWNSSTASEWSNRRPNYLLLKPRIWSMLKNSPGNLSYTEKLEKLREDFADNSDLQGDDISLTNIPHFVEAERVREYISKFGTVVECFPGEFPALKPAVEKCEARCHQIRHSRSTVS